MADQAKAFRRHQRKIAAHRRHPLARRDRRYRPLPARFLTLEGAGIGDDGGEKHHFPFKHRCHVVICRNRASPPRSRRFCARFSCRRQGWNRSRKGSITPRACSSPRSWETSPSPPSGPSSARAERPTGALLIAGLESCQAKVAGRG